MSSHPLKDKTGAEANASKPVVQMDLDGNAIEEFVSAKDAADKLGFNAGNIGLCCRGCRVKHKGFRWRFKDDLIFNLKSR